MDEEEELLALVAELRIRSGRPVGSSSRAQTREAAANNSTDDEASSKIGEALIKGRSGYHHAGSTPSRAHVGAALTAPPLASMVYADTYDLCHRKITAVPERVIDMLREDVVRLALGYNLLTSLPASFAELANLRYLNIRANLLTTFPSVITELPSLEILDISRNKLRSMPAENYSGGSASGAGAGGTAPGRLLHLRVLSISNNRMRRLPAYIAHMEHLKILKIEGNPLVWPPPHVATLPATPQAAALADSGAASPPSPARGGAQQQQPGDAAGAESDRALSRRRKAEDRTMNAWIKSLQSWMNDQTGVSAVEH